VRLADEGRALLIATHDVDQARRWDVVLCLNGRQVAFGAPAETLTLDVLEETYGADLVTVHHHHHDDRGAD
jgi:ABC-type Mn2+/Zn2+ transport system ATPase subunit